MSLFFVPLPVGVEGIYLEVKTRQLAYGACDDRLEAENPGLLPLGLTVDDLRRRVQIAQSGQWLVLQSSGNSFFIEFYPTRLQAVRVPHNR